MAKIAEGFPAKTMEEIKDYSKAFWQKWESHIENGHKYVERIERGEAEIEKYKSIEQAIEDKFHFTFKRFLEANPEKTIRDFTLDDFFIMKSMKGPQSNSPFEFSDEEDKFISISLYKFGYGSWDLIRNDLRNNERFILNWVTKTRSA